jgi:hypothetical protein
MGQITLELIWIGSFKATYKQTNHLYESVIKEASNLELSDYVTEVCESSNGLIQFVILPIGSREGFPKQNSWEKLVAFAAMKCAGTSFSVKRLYVASN